MNPFLYGFLDELEKQARFERLKRLGMGAALLGAACLPPGCASAPKKGPSQQISQPKQTAKGQFESAMGAFKKHKGAWERFEKEKMPTPPPRTSRPSRGPRVDPKKKYVVRSWGTGGYKERDVSPQEAQRFSDETWAIGKRKR